MKSMKPIPTNQKDSVQSICCEAAKEAEEKVSGQKKTLRKKMKELRKAIPDREAKNRQILSHLLQLPQVQEADSVYVYASYGTEAGTFELIQACLAMGKQVALPRVLGSEMDFYRIESLGDLQPGAYGIPEPMEHCQKVTPSLLKECMILPGLAFDKAGHRLGYGGGYYDRYLEQYPFDAPCKIALSYESQMIDDIPAEPTDIFVGMVVTEAGVHVAENGYYISQKM